MNMENYEASVRGSEDTIQSSERSTRRLDTRSNSPATGPMPSRVCDGCIRRKVKCRRRYYASPRMQVDDDAYLDDSMSTSGDSPASSTLRPRDASKEPNITQSANSLECEISPWQEEYLYRKALCCQDLISTMTIITAKLIGFALEGPDLDARIDHLLSANHLELDIIGDSPTLDQMRKAYILAFYEFHQFPGDQSWMRMGRLTRIAYRVGIDKLERLPTFYSDWAAISKAEMQEWRLLWWCIYKVDSYTNLAAGTPYLINKDFINTALLTSQSSTILSNGGSNDCKEVYLPTSSEDLWEVIPALTSNPDTFLANIHIVTVTAMRDVALVGRIYFLRAHADTVEAFSEAGRQLSALRLALPFGWLNTDRNALAGESQPNHHARLVTIFHLSFAQLFMEVLNCRGEEGEGWTRSWQRILENCQNVARAAARWDSSFCVRVDPAISLVFLTALIFLEVHKKTSVSSATVNLESIIKQDQAIIRLLLDQFAKIWTLPRLIILSFESFRESFSGVSGSLSQRQIKAILMGYKGPLHPRWVQFLASVRTIVNDAG
uniref:Regulatory protein CAT8 n=1 Tax=Talaromyces marneffei PM1 TaxID=1077442 RepID=A0A093V9W0_TALMA